MKKVRILITTLLMALLVTGCGKSPQEILSDASEKMTTLDNYHMVMDTNMEMSIQGSILNINVDADSDVDLKNGTVHMNMTTSFFGEESSSESYTLAQNDQNITYTLQEDEWYKQESAVEEEFNFNILKEASNIEELEDNTYKISLTEEQVREILNNSLDENSGIDDAVIDTENLSVEVTVGDGYVTKIVLIMPITLTSEGTMVDVDCTMAMEFSQFNEVGNVTIPSDIIENAIDFNVYETALYAESYISAISWKLGFDEDNHIYTNTELEYGGPQPSKVEISIVDSEIADGIIEINGYRATIVAGTVTDVTKID